MPAQRTGFVQIAGIAVALPEKLRKQLLTICNDKQVTLQTLGEVDHRFALACAEAVNTLLEKQNIQPNKLLPLVVTGKLFSTRLIHNTHSHNKLAMQT